MHKNSDISVTSIFSRTDSMAGEREVQILTVIGFVLCVNGSFLFMGML